MLKKYNTRNPGSTPNQTNKYKQQNKISTKSFWQLNKTPSSVHVAENSTKISNVKYLFCGPDCSD